MTARRPAGAPPPVHTDAAHRAIKAELVRLTLGGRGPARPELCAAPQPPATGRHAARYAVGGTNTPIGQETL